MVSDVAVWVKEYGIGGALVIGNITLLFVIVKWTLATTRDILVQAAKERESNAKERESWNQAVNKHGDAIDRIIGSLTRHDEKAEERGRYVREEHKQMIETLGRINGYKG